MHPIKGTAQTPRLNHALDKIAKKNLYMQILFKKAPKYQIIILNISHNFHYFSIPPKPLYKQGKVVCTSSYSFKRDLRLAGGDEKNCFQQILFFLVLFVYYYVLPNIYVYRTARLFYEEGNLDAIQKDEAKGCTVSRWT
jgi:hypothetical protein